MQVCEDEEGVVEGANHGVSEVSAILGQKLEHQSDIKFDVILHLFQVLVHCEGEDFGHHEFLLEHFELVQEKGVFSPVNDFYVFDPLL